MILAVMFWCAHGFVRVAAAALLVGAVATSQQLTVSALGPPPPGVVASSVSGQQSSSLPLGPVTSQQSLTATASSFADTATATLGVVPGSATVALTSTSQRAASFPTGLSRASAAGSFDVDLSGPASGELVITYWVLADVTPDLRVDVGADGSLELQVTAAGQVVTGNLRVPIQSTGPVRTRCTLGVTTGAGYWSSSRVDVAVSFAPRDSVLFVAGAPGCWAGGTRPVLSGRDTRTASGHRLDFRVDNAFPNGFAALLFGADTAFQPITLPPNCSFLVRPAAWVMLPTDAAGVAAWRFDLLRPYSAATLYTQALPFDFSPRVFSSNRLDVILVP